MIENKNMKGVLLIIIVLFVAGCSRSNPEAILFDGKWAASEDYCNVEHLTFSDGQIVVHLPRATVPVFEIKKSEVSWFDSQKIALTVDASPLVKAEAIRRHTYGPNLVLNLMVSDNEINIISAQLLSKSISLKDNQSLKVFNLKRCK